MTGDLFQGGIL